MFTQNSSGDFSDAAYTKPNTALLARITEGLRADAAPALADQTEAAEGETAARFVIDSEQAASWALGKFADKEAEKARIKAQYEKRLAEIETDLRGLHSRFDSELEAWAKGEAQRRRRKTVTLPDGSLTFRTVPAKLVIMDGEAAFANARTVCAEAIIEQTTVTLDTKAYLAFCEATGDFTGVERQPEREAFKIDTSGGKQKPDAE